MSLDIIFLLRRLVHEGTPLDTVANAVLNDISLRCTELYNLNNAQREWICRLLKIGMNLNRIIVRPPESDFVPARKTVIF